MLKTGRPARINTFSFGFRGAAGPQRRMEAADQHNEIELNFVNHGGLILQHGAKKVGVVAGELIIYWAAVPHQVVSVRPRTVIAWLSLPLSWFLSWNLPPTLGRHILDGGVLRIPRRKTHGLPQADMPRWTSDLQTRSAELEGIVELELEAYFRRLALACSRPGSPPILGKSSSLLQRDQYGHVQKMVQFMTSHFQESLTVPRVAAAAGLNAEYAMRLFRKGWGMTIGDFLRQQRVWHAQRLLALGGAKIVDVAFACGFGSASRFYAAFSRQCRCTPRDYRRRSIDRRGCPPTLPLDSAANRV